MDEMQHRQETPIQIWLSHRIDGDMASARLGLPATRRDLERDLVVTVRATEIKALGSHLPRNPDLDELNHLAHLLAGMPGQDREVFGAVMESGRHTGSLGEIINAAQNLDEFDLYPGHFSWRDLGDILLDMRRDEFAQQFQRLESSDTPEDRAFAAHIQRLEKSADLRIYAQQEGGSLTRTGYLQQFGDELPQTYTGPEDIPAEHRVTAPAKARESLLGALESLRALEPPEKPSPAKDSDRDCR